MEELEQMKKILRKNGMSGKDLAKELGISYASYRTMTGKSAKVVPKWAKAFVLGYKMNEEPDLLCISCREEISGFGKDYAYCQDCAKQGEDVEIQK